MARRVAKAEAPPDDGALPGVLTVAAVKGGYMPSCGESGLPASLEGDVPPEYRYWLAKDAHEAREVRDALVEAGLFTRDSVMEVDGAPRRTVLCPHLVVVGDGGEELAKRVPAGQYAALRVCPSSEAVRVFEADEAPEPAELAKESGGKPWLAAYEDGEEVRASLAGVAKSAFVLETRPGLLFASSLALVAPDGVGAVELQAAKVAPEGQEEKPPAKEPVVKDARGFRILKNDGAEERYVLGIVLEPEVADAQGDIYSAEEIRKAAHRFMEEYSGRMVVQHARDEAGEPVPEPSIKVLETYLAPVGFEVGEQKVKAGTWLLAARFQDDALWKSVKDGGLTGWSIGGWAKSTPEPVA